MIKDIMLLRKNKTYIIYFILILYFLIPMLDSMVCAVCMGNAPFQGETPIGHLQAARDDVSYSSKEDTPSKTAGTQDVKSYCSICANVLMVVKVVSLNPYTAIDQCEGSKEVLPLSGCHHSINKPPQNHLV